MIRLQLSESGEEDMPITMDCPELVGCTTVRMWLGMDLSFPMVMELCQDWGWYSWCVLENSCPVRVNGGWASHGKLIVVL